MGNGKFRTEDFANPPEKVRLMFAAVTEMIAEKTDIASLKVSDITDRAGIGKGTAYEYFSSKEEIIAMALFYEYGQKITELAALVEEQKCFQDKLFCILDWLHDNRGYHMTFIRMIQIVTGSRDFCQSIRESVHSEVFQEMHAYLCEKGDAIMEQGCREGAFTETDIVKRRLAMATMILQFALTDASRGEHPLFPMEYEKLRPCAPTPMRRWFGRSIRRPMKIFLDK